MSYRRRVLNRARSATLQQAEEAADAQLASSGLRCYQCMREVAYLFDDGRGACCTRLTKEEVDGGEN